MIILGRQKDFCYRYGWVCGCVCVCVGGGGGVEGGGKGWAG